jgi:hypothetical protein
VKHTDRTTNSTLAYVPNPIDVLIRRLRDANDKNDILMMGCTVLTVSWAGSSVATFGVTGFLAVDTAAVNMKLAVRGRKIYCAYQDLKENYNKLPDMDDAALDKHDKQVNDVIKIVDKAIEESIGDGKLITKDKLAHIYNDTFKIVKEADASNIKLTHKVKDALSNTIADQLNSNKKQETLLKKAKSIVERGGHIPMKKDGYKVYDALKETLDSQAAKSTSQNSPVVSDKKNNVPLKTDMLALQLAIKNDDKDEQKKQISKISKASERYIENKDKDLKAIEEKKHLNEQDKANGARIVIWDHPSKTGEEHRIVYKVQKDGSFEAIPGKEADAYIFKEPAGKNNAEIKLCQKGKVIDCSDASLRLGENKENSITGSISSNFALRGKGVEERGRGALQ